MFNIFKKTKDVEEINDRFEIELTASLLAYEVARSDGDIDYDESFVTEEIKKISKKVNKNENEILRLIESL